MCEQHVNVLLPFFLHEEAPACCHVKSVAASYSGSENKRINWDNDSIEVILPPTSVYLPCFPRGVLVIY